MRPWFASRARMVAARRRSYGCRWVMKVKVRAHVWSLKPRHAADHPADTSSARGMGANTLRTDGGLA
jgi:hypothetical protein